MTKQQNPMGPKKIKEDEKSDSMDKKEKVRRCVSDALDLPTDLTCHLPRIVLSGDSELLLENHRGILQYNDTMIRAAYRGGILEISGENLSLPILKPDMLAVEGTIITLRFVRS